MNYIMQNWDWIIGGLGIMFVFGYFGIYSKRFRSVIKTALDIMIYINNKNDIENEEKMDIVVVDIMSMIDTKYHIFVNEKVVRFFLEALYRKYKKKINLKSQHNELLKIIAGEIGKDMAKKAIDEYKDKLIKTDYNNNYDIVGNDTIITFAEEGKKDIELRLKAQAEAMYDSNLKAKGLIGLDLIKKF